MPTTPPEIEEILHEVQRQAQIRNWNAQNLDYVVREALTALHQKHQEEVEKAVLWLRQIQVDPRDTEPFGISFEKSDGYNLGLKTAADFFERVFCDKHQAPTKPDKQTKV